ncbi:MAG TPA: hypothetical protein VLE43_00370 [Candidatus Saccharimonadia bacterium]|nr:hypothetical protein [Candidatus Saccharimonadia bacterium]
MSVNDISQPVRLLLAMLLVCVLMPATPARADEAAQVEEALVELAKAQEAQGFDFRADIWERELSPEMGKAVRVQFFKGNEYRVCLAVSPKSGVQIVSAVLDSEGKPIESKVEKTAGGWGMTLHVTPKRTGVYMVTVRHAGGTQKKALCAMISGYK